MSTLNILSLGAGVQSTAVLLLAAEGALPPLDAAIFADTGWEPKAVYEHLDRLEAEVARPAGIPIIRVSSGNIREDALDPTHRFASMPVFVRNPDGSKGITRRQCTSEYKLKPIKEAVRRLLGAKDREDGKPGRVPRGHIADQWIGISLDEVHRAKDSDVAYTRNVFPLLDLRWTREHCLDYLRRKGWGNTAKSACIGCPFHGNATWRRLRDEQPAEWADAVEFDAAIRNGSARANSSGSPLRGQMFLHRSLVPLSIAPIDHKTRTERAGVQLDLFTETEVDAGCNQFSCRSDLYDMSKYEIEGGPLMTIIDAHANSDGRAIRCDIDGCTVTLVPGDRSTPPGPWTTDDAIGAACDAGWIIDIFTPGTDKCPDHARAAIA